MTITEYKKCTIGNTTGCSYGWLYDRTSINCTTYGCLHNAESRVHGYWTSSARASGTDIAWRVHDYGAMGSLVIDNSTNHYGIRPVIEIKRSKIDE